MVVVSEERGTISFCFNGNVVTNLDGASLRQALLGLFGQSGARKRGKGGSKRAGTVTQTGTGTFRIVPPAGAAEPRSGRASETPPAPLGPSEVTGSAILAPPVPRAEAAAKSEKESSKPAAKPNARPMVAAKPIETPKPVSAPPTPTRPTEE